MSSELPFVSVILPVRNEERDIRPCLESILQGTYPVYRLEVLVVDGQSTDRTREIVSEMSREYEGRVRLVDNPRKIAATAMNLGVAAAKGEFIARMDGHNACPPEYFEKLARAMLSHPEVDNVGCAIDTLPRDESRKARAIAIAASESFGVGNSLFRTGVTEETYADTVPYGFFRRTTFEKYGKFDEEMVRNQDDEFNHRILAKGGRILLIPGVRAVSYARGTYQQLWRMFYQYGLYKPLALSKVGKPATYRQFAPIAFFGLVFALAVGGLLASSPSLAWAALGLGGAYALGCAAAAIRSASRRGGGISLAPWIAVGFFVMHLSYGLGYAMGVWQHLIKRRRIDYLPSSR